MDSTSFLEDSIYTDDTYNSSSDKENILQTSNENYDQRNISQSKQEKGHPDKNMLVVENKDQNKSIINDHDEDKDGSVIYFAKRKVNKILDSASESEIEDYDDGTDEESSHCKDEINITKDNEEDSLHDDIQNKAERSTMEAKEIIESTINSELEIEGDAIDNFANQRKSCSNEVSSTDDESEDNDVIDVSSGEEVVPFTPKKQITLHEAFRNESNRENLKLKQEQPGDTVSIKVSKSAYEEQKLKVQTLKVDLLKVQNLLRTVNLPALPDKGLMLQNKYDNLKNTVDTAEAEFNKMIIIEDSMPVTTHPKPVAWEDLKVMSENVQPKTFGQQAMATLNIQKSLTMDRLQQLHTSLATCPTEDTFAKDPKGLKVQLMPHQQHALAWLLWRENQKPSGGILADDMGLGKTLTMISLMLKNKEMNKNNDDESDEENERERGSKYKGGTLVVCPASVLRQWASEVEKHCKKYIVTVELYHGRNRETKAKYLAKHDMVITTYTICLNEFEKISALYRVRWARIILDEAHQIRNHKSQTSIAICGLSGRSRWALTGTPVHNKELDLYSLLKFLRCSPFDDLAVWKRWVANKSTGGQDRIQTVMSSIMLRRTKVGLQETGGLQNLPDRSFETINIKLQQEEQAVYQRILTFSRTLFAQYLHQHAQKESEYVQLSDFRKQANDVNGPYYKMHQRLLKLNRIKEVKSHEILVLLLRLRQMCCHPSLIVKMLHDNELNADEEAEGAEEFNIIEEMNKLNLGGDGAEEVNGNFNGTLKDLLNPKSPMFSKERKSTKIQAVLALLKDKIIKRNEKAIVVSQWKSFLQLLGNHLKEDNICFEQLDGSVVVAKRMDIVDNFNNPNHPAKILLLSLTAGGVGLNLTGGNHMLLMDLHWNPQLEMQAQDRIYRVGQTRKVHIYKFIVVNTIEERIKALQEHKLSLANSMLTGSKILHTKLSLQDLRMLFNM